MEKIGASPDSLTASVPKTKEAGIAGSHRKVCSSLSAHLPTAILSKSLLVHKMQNKQEAVLYQVSADPSNPANCILDWQKLPKSFPTLLPT